MIKTFGQNFLRLDYNLFALVSGRDEGQVLKIFYKGLSRLGDGHLYILFALWEMLFNGYAGRMLVLVILLAFAMELPAYMLIKKSVKRLRPFERYPKIPFFIKPPDQYSFPSGHTAAAFLMARLISWQLPLLSFLLFVLAGLIGYSRVYLRVHYPSDVLFGLMLGLLAANLALMIVF